VTILSPKTLPLNLAELLLNLILSLSSARRLNVSKLQTKSSKWRIFSRYKRAKLPASLLPEIRLSITYSGSDQSIDQHSDNASTNPPLPVSIIFIHSPHLPLSTRLSNAALSLSPLMPYHPLPIPWNVAGLPYEATRLRHPGGYAHIASIAASSKAKALIQLPPVRA